MTEKGEEVRGKKEETRGGENAFMSGERVHLRRREGEEKKKEKQDKVCVEVDVVERTRFIGLDGAREKTNSLEPNCCDNGTVTGDPVKDV